MKNSQDLSINRRRLLKGTALGLSSTFLGCQVSSSNAQQTTAQTPTTESDSPEYRVYIIKPADQEAFYQLTLKASPRIERFAWGSSSGFGRLNQPNTPRTVKQRDPDWLVWANKEQAIQLESEASIESLRLLDAKSVVMIGDPKQAKGKLGVRLFPNSAKQNPEKETFASIDDVVSLWRKELADINGLSIKKGPQHNDRKWGAVPHNGQILIEFKGELDPKVLKVIKSHPQTVAINWGDLFRYYFCPGCGLG